MKRFNAGMWRPARGDAPLAAANDLVRRTLGQHGLLPQDGQGAGATLPSLDEVLAQFGGGAKVASPLPEPIPEGAKFAQNSFSCESGSRAYRVYSPAPRAGGATGVVLMLHGCTQSPEDFATGTGMNVLADQHGFVVVYPAQSRGSNAQSCWNWFSHGDQRRGKGEPAILAALTQQICADHGIGREATFVAGLSAGAAMATILGEAYPDVFAAVGAHSGLPVGAAKDMPSAFAAMAGTASNSGPAQTDSTVRTIVFHGTADATVHPSNGDRIVQRALTGAARQVIEDTQSGQAGGRSFTRVTASDTEGRQMVEHWSVAGLGHAWSGGQAGGSYTDATGPDASAEMIRFFFDSDTSEK
ncbi:PHB depolymerase family esterase [Pseudorhodobacter sp. W20_MBD10_FR17]|uniref:extracellular catalytic domain type 1 short-chain-length polyhydroxyalkanoate depolymerase n=1 Tax=Pseudorhodobacter sp. W20_MBD10_FR17 TaxID=3240266 RepID=UPI003F972F42